MSKKLIKHVTDEKFYNISAQWKHIHLKLEIKLWKTGEIIVPYHISIFTINNDILGFNATLGACFKLNDILTVLIITNPKWRVKML